MIFASPVYFFQSNVEDEIEILVVTPLFLRNCLTSTESLILAIVLLLPYILHQGKKNPSNTFQSYQYSELTMTCCIVLINYFSIIILAANLVSLFFFSS